MIKEDHIKIDIKNPNFKAIIFDLNGTIASSVSNHPEHILYRNRYIEDQIKKPIQDGLSDVTREAFETYGLDTKAYYLYRNDRIDWRIFNAFNPVTFDVLSLLEYLQYDLVLYTDCYSVQVEETLKILNVKQFFKLIVSAELGFKKPSHDVFTYISKQLDIVPSELLMVANDWKQDLAPLHDLNGNTILIESEKELDEAQNIILNYFNNYNYGNKQ